MVADCRQPLQETIGCRRVFSAVERMLQGREDAVRGEESRKHRTQDGQASVPESAENRASFGSTARGAEGGVLYKTTTDRRNKIGDGDTR